MAPIVSNAKNQTYWPKVISNDLSSSSWFLLCILKISTHYYYLLFRTHKQFNKQNTYIVGQNGWKNATSGTTWCQQGN